MAYLALYRKWRPLVFEDVVEQEHVVKTLKNSIVSDHIAHAYLFCGTRGTGKTTMAKIFSRAINCLSPKDGDPCNQCEICKGILAGNILDVIEIDAASNNSVDDVRVIRDEVIYTPSQAKKKVYIIDEVHMLSTGAFNALLKTLEEPPSHVVFILATTEPHKLPATILSRCQRFDFRRIPIDSIVGRINKIASASEVELQSEAAKLIAKMSDGALRDAISILDQCISQGDNEITYDHVLKVVGIVNDTFLSEVVDAIHERNIEIIFAKIEELVLAGKDIAKFLSDIVLYYRNLLIVKLTENPGEIIDVMEDVLNIMKRQSNDLSKEEIILTIRELSSVESSLKWATHPRVLLEIALVKVCDCNFSKDRDSLLERLTMLEDRISSGSFVQIHSNQQSANSNEGKNEDAVKNSTKSSGKSSRHEVLELGKKDIQSLKPVVCWSEVIDDLRKNGRMVLYANLMEAKAVELSDRTIGILPGGAKSICKMLLTKAENIEVLEASFKSKIGKDVRIKCIDEDCILEGVSEAQKEENEIVKKAQEFADKINMPLDIIEE